MASNGATETVKTETETVNSGGWNGTTIAVGTKCKVHQMGMKGCRAIVLGMNATHAEIRITRGNKTWVSGNRTTVGIWWLEGGAL